MTQEELLKPRYKVIADYPQNWWKVGQIIPIDNEREEKQFIQYPHLFKKLEWWEEREGGFIKSIKFWRVIESAFEVVEKNQIITAHDFKWWGFADDAENLRYFLPATESEYKSFIQQH